MPSEPLPRDTALPASIEATPKQVSATSGLKGALPRGTSVYLTDLGTDNVRMAVAAAVRLREFGYEPVPHIAVRRLPGREALIDVLTRMTAEAGVRDVLVVGGGVARPAGPYSASIEVLETGLLDRFGITRIGVAGHPEGSPDISPAAIDDALHLKVAFANRTGADLRIVTQFGFDPDGTICWLEDIASAGFDIPVHLGVAGPAKISTLLKYAAVCGVGPSLNFLKNGAGLLAAIATSYSPEAYTEPLERWHRTSANSRLAALHVFPFGGFAASANWLLGRGSLNQTIETPDHAAGLQEGGLS